MLTADEYAELTGQFAPEEFPVLLLHAEELLHARTLQQFRREGIPPLPLELFKRALAMQVAFMDIRGGLEGWGDPAIVRELGLFPTTGSTMKGYYYIQFTEDERFPRRGGNYLHGGSIGLGCEYCNLPRGHAFRHYGARPRSLCDPES